MQTLEAYNCTVSRVTKGKLPSLPFVAIKEAILGTTYELEVSFVTPLQMRELSITHKGDPTHMNVLSFPYSKKSGEIYLCLQSVRREAPRFQESYDNHLLFLVIHGMLHLKGFDHGAIMEKHEARYVSLFKK